jgi:signal transduction histidine kinase/ActR/RegA family two-component response regulator
MSQRDALQWEPAPAPAEHARIAVLLDELRARAVGGGVVSTDLAERALEACSAALHSARRRQQQQLEDILAAVSRLAAHDFAHRVPEPSGDDISDYIVHGVNMLAEVLEETTVSRRYLDAIVDTMVDPLLVVSPVGITHANAAAVAQLGGSSDRLRGLPLERFMLLDDEACSPLSHADLSARCESGPVRDLAVQLMCRGGRRVTASVNASVLERDATGADQIVLVVRDMTEMFGLLDAAHEALADKSRFLAAVSHEMRTPMHGVIAMTSLMLRGQLALAQRSQLEVIQRSAGALVSLVDDLLQLSKLDAGHMQLDLQDVALGSLVDDVVALLASKAEQVQLWVRAEVDPLLPGSLRADATRLRQVLVNLLGNAIKFTERGGVQLRVSVIERNDDRVCVRIEVVDSGIGIALADQAAVFEPFVQRAHDRERFGGTGLGLTISRHLVQLMGGELRCASALGQGSRFWFDVELEVVSTVAPSVTESSRPTYGERRVLIADDEPANRAVLVAMVQNLGAQADAVANGREATEAVASGNYDLVLMDWEMPEMNGLQATRAIRAREAHGLRVPIVCLTGHATELIASAIQQAGFDACMQKPFLLSQLNDVLSRFVGESFNG